MGIRAFLEADQIAALRAPPQEMLDRAAVDEDLHLVPSQHSALLEDLKLAARSAHDDVTRGLLHKWIWSCPGAALGPPTRPPIRP